MIVVYCLTVRRLHNVVKNFKLTSKSDSLKDNNQTNNSPGSSPFNFKLLAVLALARQTSAGGNSGDTGRGAANCGSARGSDPDSSGGNCGQIDVKPPPPKKKNSFVGLRRSVNSQSSVSSYRIIGSGGGVSAETTGFTCMAPRLDTCTGARTGLGGFGFRRSTTNSNGSHNFLECKSLSKINSINSSNY